MDWTIELPTGFADVGDGATVSVIIDPAARTVTDYHVSIGGSSWPRSVHNGRALMVRVPRRATTDSVTAILRENEGILESIARAYRGDRWDGQNFVGQWGEDGRPHEYLDALAHELGRADRRWRADEWLDWVLVAMGWTEIARAICPMALEIGWGRATDAFLAEDRSEGVLVATDAAAREIRAGLEYYLDDLEDELAELRDLIRRALAE